MMNVYGKAVSSLVQYTGRVTATTQQCEVSVEAGCIKYLAKPKVICDVLPPLDNAICVGYLYGTSEIKEGQC